MKTENKLVLAGVLILAAYGVHYALTHDRPVSFMGIIKIN